MDYWNLPVSVDEQVCGDIGRIQNVEFRINWNRDWIFGNAYIDGEIAGYGAGILFAQPVLSIIAGIVCIDKTYANSLLAVYVYDKSYQAETYVLLYIRKQHRY